MGGGNREERMSKLPADLFTEVDELLGIEGRPYLRLAGGEIVRTDCYRWSKAESTLEVVSSISPELSAIMSACQERMASDPDLHADPMGQIRAYIAGEAPHLLGEYDFLVANLEAATKRYAYPTEQEPPEIPAEIKEVAERIAAQASSGMGDGQFDIEAYVRRAQELWKQEPDELQEAQKRYEQEVQQYQESLLEAQELKKDRLAAVRAHLDGMPYTAYGDVIVAPTDDQYDLLRIEETNGANYGLQTEDLIDALTLVDARFGIDIVDAAFDFVRIRLRRVPTGQEAEALVDELLELCPDLEGEQDPLADGEVALWWD